MTPPVQMRGGILIVEDHAATARLLHLLLSEAFSAIPVEAVSSAEEMFVKFGGAFPSVVVMDISLSGMNGIEATRRIKAISPTIEVVIHSNLEPGIYSDACIKAGASAYVRKAQPKSQLIAEIRRLLG